MCQDWSTTEEPRSWSLRTKDVSMQSGVTMVTPPSPLWRCTIQVQTSGPWWRTCRSRGGARPWLWYKDPGLSSVDLRLRVLMVHMNKYFVSGSCRALSGGFEILGWNITDRSVFWKSIPVKNCDFLQLVSKSPKPVWTTPRPWTIQTLLNLETIRMVKLWFSSIGIH